ncbi:MAG: response regulator [Syntrophorhabdaceae bacterium]|nr:response regulator [Syntrophorhabdaceae bacterium]
MSVSDTGVGIDKEIMGKIFDPFFTTKEPGKGTGLGLASVYGIVKQHNGYITVESSPGNGATFNVYLPLVNIPAKEEEKEEVVFSKATGTILVGEDDENIRGFLKDVLEYYGFRVLEAEDGEKLIEIFKEKGGVELIITDVIMPKKSGIDAYNVIKSMDKDAKFIFMSGYDKDMFSKIPIEDKNVRFIVKPISTDALLKAINEIL